MIPDLFWIPGPWRGRFAVATRPRGGDWLEDEARGWRRAGLDTVISLLETDEAGELGLDHEGDVAAANSIGFVSFPIPDRGVPASTQEALSLMSTVNAALHAGKSVAVHCRQGVGRSGLIAAGVLVAAGASVEKAIDAVSSARGEPVPETPEQLQWLYHLPTGQLVEAS
jgi:protein-tyrosine phosphatase